MHRRKLVYAAIGGISLFCLLFLAAMYWMVGYLIAPVNCTVAVPALMTGIEKHKIRSDSGTEIAAWTMTCEDAKATVLLLHPNRRHRGAMLRRAEILRDAGYASLMIDFQGHGETHGDFITAGYLERLDVVAAIEYIREQFPEKKIAIVGCSLGGAATLLAEPKQVDALVLESVYPTITEAIHNRLSMRFGSLRHLLAPALFFQFQVRLGISPSQLRPIDHLQNIECPVLIAAGDCDRHTTLAETHRMFSEAESPKQLLIFEGAKHEDLLNYDPSKYREVIEFLDITLASYPAENADLE